MSRTKQIKYDAFKSDPKCFSYYWGEDKTDLINTINSLAEGRKIFVELCAGYCDYSLEFARNHKDYLCIAVDIKEDRLYSGLRVAKEEELDNFICLRLNISHLSEVFENYIDLIYLVHPDPQVNNKRKRLNQPKYIKSYESALKQSGQIVLITDNNDFYNEYLENNHLGIINSTFNAELELSEIKILPTRYNQKFINLDNNTKVGLFIKSV